MQEFYVGIMSGTSLDGIDIALTALDSPQHAELISAACVPFPQDLHDDLLALCSPGAEELRRAGLAGQAWARLAAQGVNNLLAECGVDATCVNAIGSHGQTIRHHPELGFSVQIGAPALLAELCGIDVVSDFRSRDLAAGGEGAPLVPAFHDWLLRSETRSRILINIGGFANLTVLEPGGAVTGFDSGPGNVLLDHWIHKQKGLPFDDGGAWAQEGRYNALLLEQMLNDPYFSRTGPKSTGREYFNPVWLTNQLDAFADVIDSCDVQATLAELTARTIGNAVQAQSSAIQEVYICGGGARNEHLMKRLQALLAPVQVHSTAALGVDPDWMEAIAFAWLAWRCVKRQPGNLPAVTGAKGQRVLGTIYPA